MEKKVFKQEKEKLKSVVQKLTEEKKELIENLNRTSTMYDKEDYIRAHLLYLNQKKVNDINHIIDKPYFARIDFTAKNETLEKIYIGKLSILDSKKNTPIVIDWRAPISNLYYDGRIGPASYICPEGEINGDISLKRQYFIENQELKKYNDIDLKTNDELLQNAISEKADDRLKNIVATIQEDQNRIIRADIHKPLIVQGVAGSGKTTIALHRIAYLIYQYGKEFKPDSFMIIAPNKFFLDYISNILPDLGVEDVKQYTFEDFAYEVIGKKLKISDSNEKLVTIVNRDFDDINKGNIDIMIKESKFKSSMKFKDLVDNYLLEIEKNYIPQKDFTVANYLIMEQKEIFDLFIHTYKRLCYKDRIREIKKHMLSKLREKSDYISENIRKRRTLLIRKYEKSGINEEELKSKRIEIYEKTDKVIKRIENCDKKLIDNFFKEISNQSALEYYKEFIRNYIKEDDVGEVFQYLIGNTLNNLNKKEISFEDLAPIIYIHYRIYGAKLKTKLSHVVIDEAQDYGEFQFSVLKTILDSNSMTILGDIAQGVHSYRGISNWQDFIKVEFKDTDVDFQKLDITYRTTVDIMEKGNEVIQKLPKEEMKDIVIAKPIIKSKDSLKIIKKVDTDDIIKEITEKINEYLNMNYKSIAIIGKDMKECNEIKKKLKVKNVNLITSKDSKYSAGISIVPSYLAKGLEFDCVMLFNVNNQKYTTSSLDIKLLYVAITRAMSKLDIFYTGEKSLLI